MADDVIKDYLPDTLNVQYLQEVYNEGQSVYTTPYRLSPYTPYMIEEERDTFTKYALPSSLYSFNQSSLRFINPRKRDSEIYISEFDDLKADTEHVLLATTSSLSQQPMAIIPVKTGIEFVIKQISIAENLKGYYIKNLKVGYCYGECIQVLITSETFVQYISNYCKRNLQELKENKTITLQSPIDLSMFIPDSITVNNLGIILQTKGDPCDIKVSLEEDNNSTFDYNMKQYHMRIMDFYEEVDNRGKKSIYTGEELVSQQRKYKHLLAYYSDKDKKLLSEYKYSFLDSCHVFTPLSESKIAAMSFLHRTFHIVNSLAFDIACGIQSRPTYNSGSLSFENSLYGTYFYDFIAQFGLDISSKMLYHTATLSFLFASLDITNITPYSDNFREIKDILNNPYLFIPQNTTKEDLKRLYLTTSNVAGKQIENIHLDDLIYQYFDRCYYTGNSFITGNKNLGIGDLRKVSHCLPTMYKYDQILRAKEFGTPIIDIDKYNYPTLSICKNQYTYSAEMTYNNDTLKESTKLKINLFNSEDYFNYINTINNDVVLNNIAGSTLEDQLSEEYLYNGLPYGQSSFNYSTDKKKYIQKEYRRLPQKETIREDQIEDYGPILLATIECQNNLLADFAGFKELIPHLLYDITDNIDVAATISNGKIIQPTDVKTLNYNAEELKPLDMLIPTDKIQKIVMDIASGVAIKITNSMGNTSDESAALNMFAGYSEHRYGKRILISNGMPIINQLNLQKQDEVEFTDVFTNLMGKTLEGYIIDNAYSKVAYAEGYKHVFSPIVEVLNAQIVSSDNIPVAVDIKYTYWKDVNEMEIKRAEVEHLLKYKPTHVLPVYRCLEHPEYLVIMAKGKLLLFKEPKETRDIKLYNLSVLTYIREQLGGES